MIKVNLLEGAADTRAATRATKAAAKTTQQVLLLAGALLALLIALGVDFFVSNAQLTKATDELAEQQRQAAELKKNREQKDALEKQIKSVEERIKIIDDLQKTQQGPSRLLNLINAKMPSSGNVRLEAIKQSKDTLIIEGIADNPDPVSEFAKGLELGSDGLFQSVGLSVTRQDEKLPDPEGGPERIVTTYKFTISTRYTPTLVGQAPETADGQPAAAGAAAPAGQASPSSSLAPASTPVPK